MTKEGKFHREAKNKFTERVYAPKHALELIRSVSRSKYDETVEFNAQTNANPKKQEQNLRIVTTLPHGTGRQVRVCAFVESTDFDIARKAGADFVSDDEVLNNIKTKGWHDFEATVATRSMMPKIAPLGKFLGRKGLMPSPKTGTVVELQDLASVITKLKKGQIEIKLDRTSGIHTIVGKLSFTDEQLLENLATIYRSIYNNKPESLKGALLKKVTLSSTTSPGAELVLAKLEELSV